MLKKTTDTFVHIEPKQWVVLVTVPQEGFSIFHRKLFPGAEQLTRSSWW